ncbi:MAG: hypothetical protein NTV64_00315 [Polaromonas sp.]|nr:hypothetical protein [Polaromonas sp.]
MKKLFCLLFLGVSTTVFAAQVIPAEIMQPPSMSRACTSVDCVDSLNKFKSLTEIQPAEMPVVLKKRTNLGFFERSLTQRANKIFDSNPAVAMILVEKYEIVYERYHPEVNEKTPLLVYSISKSLASMTVG